MVKQLIPPVLIGVGVLLLVLGTNWVRIQPPTSLWTEDDHNTLEQVEDEIVRQFRAFPPQEAERYEALLREGTFEGVPEPYAKAVQRRNTLHAERDIAMNRPKQIAATLHWTGLSLVAVGVVAFCVVRQLPG